MSAPEIKSPDSDGDVISLVCAATDSYAMPLAVTLRSALENLSGRRNVHVTVLDGGIEEANKQRLRQTIQGVHRVEISFVTPRAQLLHGLPTTKKYPLTVYYRLLLPDVLPRHIHKVLYLDGDLVVTGDLSRLWQQDMGAWHAMAVQDICHRFVARTNHLSRPEFQVPPGQKYLNSGVMLIDLDKWRQDDIAGQAMEYLRAYPQCMLFADQDGLNLALAGKWGELDPRWNQIHEIHEYANWQESPYDETTYRAVLTAPYVIHFTTPPKPWMTGCTHPKQDVFFHYVDQTPWTGWRNTLLRRAFGKLKERIKHVTQPRAAAHQPA